MFEEFFERCEMQNAEKITEEQSENIKAALREKLAADNSPSTQSNEEKEKNIMKTKPIRTIIIAAAIATVGLAGVVGATSALLTREEIAADLATKNSPSDEYYDKISEAEEYAGREIHATPWYDVMDVEEFAIREMEPADYKGWEEGFTGIILEHVDEDGGGIAQLITSDGHGGYLYNGKLIEDEKLLEAIAEGTEKYGDTFIIMY